jgi:hypothetical protein
MKRLRAFGLIFSRRRCNRMFHVYSVEDSNGDLIDQLWYCSYFCYRQAGHDDLVPTAWPGGQETDYDVHCVQCKDLMWKGISNGA